MSYKWFLDPNTLRARQFVPLQEYKRNLETLVQRVFDMGVPNVFLLTSPPVSDVGRQQFNQISENSPAPDCENQVTGWYASACMEVARELRLPVLNVWKEMQRIKNWRDLLADGLHLNDNGNRILSKLVVHAMKD